MGKRRTPLNMRIELTTIEDLGIKLYSRLPQALSELVANAWDADASVVRISLPEGKVGPGSAITVRDDGHGMTYAEIGGKYLRVGRKRRSEEGGKTRGGRRDAMGRKGIGKLSVFGIAKNVEIRTVRNGRLNAFRMDADDMLRDAKKTGKYAPRVVSADEHTEDGDGTAITLTGLSRKTPIDAKSVRRGIAKHFAVIGDGFAVLVNGRRILPSDKFGDGDWEAEWHIDEPVGDDHPEWVVSGRIMASRRPLDEEDRGVIVTARGKLIQTPTDFGARGGSRHARSHIAGEVRAEFCDDADDSVSTDRHSVTDTPQGTALREWGAKRLGGISSELAKARRAAREKAIRQDPEIKPWLGRLDKPQGRLADKIIRAATSAQADGAKQKELVLYARASFEQSAFLDMAEALGERPDPEALLEMFRGCGVVEARELERIVKARLVAIDRLIKFMDGGGDAPALHDCFRGAPWMIDPSWTQWQEEPRLSRLLAEKFPDGETDEDDRRIGFMAMGVGDTVHVIELKRPGYAARSEDFGRLSRYVGFAKDMMGDGRYNGVAGYLVAGGMPDGPGAAEMARTFEASRYYIRTYGDLAASARRLHRHFKDRLEASRASTR